MGERPVRPGDVLARKYRVERIVGEGGMGLVVAATNLQLEQLVAIKLLHPDVLDRPEIVSRLVREARAVARLRSEHVVRVLDVDMLPGGTPFIVMEFLYGRDLANMIEGNGPIPIPVAVDYVLQACDAVAEAHELGIVHRDLKPANLFLTMTAHRKTSIKVLDFGVAKTVAPGNLTLTGAATIMGSPAFMSPEQLRSAHTVDGRSDIWSLGVILWQLVTGQVPFGAETFTELCIRIAVDPLPPVPRVPEMSSGLEAVLRRCLEKDPNERFQSIAELALALAPYTYPQAREVAIRLSRSLPGRENASPGELSADATLDDVLGQREHTTAESAQRSGRRRLLLGTMIGGVIATGSVIGLLSVRSSPPPPPPPAPATQPVVVVLPPTPPTPDPVPVHAPDAGTAVAPPPTPPTPTTTPPTPPPPTATTKPPKKPPRRPPPTPTPTHEVDPFKSPD